MRRRSRYTVEAQRGQTGVLRFASATSNPWATLAGDRAFCASSLSVRPAPSIPRSSLADLHPANR